MPRSFLQSDFLLHLRMRTPECFVHKKRRYSQCKLSILLKAYLINATSNVFSYFQVNCEINLKKALYSRSPLTLLKTNLRFCYAFSLWERSQRSHINWPHFQDSSWWTNIGNCAYSLSFAGIKEFILGSDQQRASRSCFHSSFRTFKSL